MKLQRPFSFPAWRDRLSYCRAVISIGDQKYFRIEKRRFLTMMKGGDEIFWTILFGDVGIPGMASGKNM